MFYSSTTLAVLGLATLARSHMIMNTPVPFGKSTLTNAPLDASGSDFPCKQRTGVYDAEGASNSMALGSTQSLAFTGGATHGGGSCQVSITYDTAPTKSSTWKVIHSIEGGCPIKNVAGNNGDSATDVDPDTYSFTIPSSLPTGTAVLAWTWFNKIGNREMYMNCAPITLTASSSKRSDEDDFMDGNYTMLMERDTAAYDALPNMFVANIPSSDCGTVDSADLKFPAPGDSLDQFGTATATPSAPTGSSCAAAVAATGAASSVNSAAASSVATTSAPAQASASGGVFITVSSAAMATASPVVSSATVVAMSSAAASSVAVESTPVASSSTPASTGTSSGTTGSGSAIAAGTACTTEGEWNCIGGTSYQRCASGAWSVVMQLAAGTSCTAGETTNINIVAREQSKRSVRFSGQHLRRHLQKS